MMKNGHILVRAAFLACVALALVGCRATSHSAKEMRADSLYQALERRVEALTLEVKTLEADDSVVTLTFDTLGRVVSQTTAVRHTREKAEKRAEQTDVVQSTTTHTSAQIKAKETAKSAPSAISCWQKAKGWVSGALCACACMFVYYYVVRRVYHDQGRNFQ